MNVLFITSTHPELKQGVGVGSHMHELMIKQIAGDSLYRFYYCRESVEIHDNQTWYMKGSTGKQKMLSVLLGINPMANRSIYKKIYEIIDSCKISIVYIDNSINGSLIKSIKNKYNNVKVIAFFHDIEAIRMKEEKSTSAFRKISLPVYAKNEKLTAQYADKTIVLNGRDAKLFEQLYGKRPDAFAPVSAPKVETINQDLAHKKGESLSILFVGVDYAPNVNGVRWFISEVMPLVKCECQFKIVGYHMEKYKDEFQSIDERVSVIGTVDRLEPFYEEADIVVGPISEGGGMKVKTAEAFLHGKRFIGCSESLVGYWEDVSKKLRDSAISKIDDEHEFAERIEAFFDSSFPKNDISIKEWADAHYTYPVILKEYKRVFEECGIE